MSGIRDLLIRGSKKVIDHYRLLLASAKKEEERELYMQLLPIVRVTDDAI